MSAALIEQFVLHRAKLFSSAVKMCDGNKHAARDLMQQFAVKCLTSKSFTGDIQYVKSYLYRGLLNTHIKNRTRAMPTVSIDDVTYEPSTDMYDVEARLDLVNLLQASWSILTKKQQEALTKYAVDGYGEREDSAEYQTRKTHVRFALNKIRKVARRGK